MTPRKLLGLATVFATVVVFGSIANRTVLAQPSGQPVEIRLTEYHIEMPATVPAGWTRFQVTNIGHHKHTFEIKGQGIKKKLPVSLKPGEAGELLIDLKPGVYKVICPIFLHKSKGMSMELKVTP